MKKLIVLSGNSQRNQAWGEGVVEHFGPWFDAVYMQYYDHWEHGEQEMNIEAELAKLKAAVNDDGVMYYVFAKSIGSLLSLLAIDQGYFKPEKCVFFGMPLELAAEGVFAGDWAPLRHFSIPTIAFHNDQDPISYEHTKSALAEHGSGSIELITREGDNHDYTEFAEFEPSIKAFIDIK